MLTANRGQPALLVTLVAAGIGAWACAALLSGHDGGWRIHPRDNGILEQLCGTSTLPSADCAEVVGSRWGSFDVMIGSRRFLVPTSYLGMAYFIGVAVWFVAMGRIPASAKRLWLATLLVVTVGLTCAVAFATLMATTLSSWCPLCVAAHLSAMAIFVAVVSLWRTMRDTTTDEEAEPLAVPLATRFRRRQAGMAMATAVAACAGLYLYYEAVREARRHWREAAAYRKAVSSVQDDAPFLIREYLAQPVVDIPPPARSPADAAESDPHHRLVVFTDFTCRSCACFEGYWRRELRPLFRPAVKAEFRHAPPRLLNPSGGPGTLVDEITDAHVLAEAASYQVDAASYVRLRSVLYSMALEGNDTAPSSYASALEAAGLHPSDLDRYTEDARAAVMSDAALARKLGVVGTPALFLDGRRVPVLCVNSRAFWKNVGHELGQGSGSYSSSRGSGSNVTARAERRKNYD